MVKKFKTNTSAFTIAHYILLFLVVGLCIGVVAWVLISRNNSKPVNNVTPQIMQSRNANPCVVRTENMVRRMWENNPKMVPEKYWNIAMDYMNQALKTRTYGICQDVAFVCAPGQIRRDCDPCAVPSARSWTMKIHIADMIEKNCDVANKY